MMTLRSIASRALSAGADACAATCPGARRPPRCWTSCTSLTVTGADGAPASAFPQYQRNTLVVDLQSASGSGLGDPEAR